MPTSLLSSPFPEGINGLYEGRLHPVCLKPHKLEVLPIDFYRFDRTTFALRGSAERNGPIQQPVRARRLTRSSGGPERPRQSVRSDHPFRSPGWTAIQGG